ncbi:MAG: transglycosylase SLT domain-containing protein [Allosphingosinicella sp.]|uniref:transglycosylase SLT domain-containing protein n=1 Tax=Allosphingosinicella sp. TaxID=2823234 RepID=UPI00394CEEA3
MFPTTINEAANGVRDRVRGAIQLASARTGVDFTYLFNQARIESGLNPNAKAPTSSATGLFQFIEQTWLATVKKHGDAHGLGWAADAIRQAPNGRFFIADPAARREILDLRRDPAAASAMAAEFASDNQSFLERRLGRGADSTDLYMAHFLGPAGAARFLAAHDNDPHAPAAPAMPAAARANRWVFYNRDGSPRSFAQIRERFAEKMGSDGAPLPSRAPRPDPVAPVRFATLNTDGRPPAGPSPQYARLAYLMLAQLGG